MARLENDGYCYEARCRPGEEHVDGNKWCVIFSERFAQLCTKNAERTDVSGKIHADSASKRNASDARRKSAHQSVTFFFWRAIDDVESLFQLFEQSRDFFGRML